MFVSISCKRHFPQIYTWNQMTERLFFHNCLTPCVIHYGCRKLQTQKPVWISRGHMQIRGCFELSTLWGFLQLILIVTHQMPSNIRKRVLLLLGVKARTSKWIFWLFLIAFILDFHTGRHPSVYWKNTKLFKKCWDVSIFKKQLCI